MREGTPIAVSLCDKEATPGRTLTKLGGHAKVSTRSNLLDCSSSSNLTLCVVKENHSGPIGMFGSKAVRLIFDRLRHG